VGTARSKKTHRKMTETKTPASELLLGGGGVAKWGKKTNEEKPNGAAVEKPRRRCLEGRDESFMGTAQKPVASQEKGERCM